MRLWPRRNQPDPLACREFTELVGDYLDGRLPAAERARMDAHIAGCDGCAGYLEGMRATIASLHALPPVAPDPHTRETLLRAFRELRGGTA
jgi:anti-sigma factor RsiW